MPGYIDWKERNCPKGAITKAESLLDTLDAVEPYLEKIWADNDETFPEKVNTHLLEVIKLVDEAEDCLEQAKLYLARLLPGHPEGDFWPVKLNEKATKKGD